jgi:phosphate transport system permease protein
MANPFSNDIVVLRRRSGLWAESAFQSIIFISALSIVMLLGAVFVSLLLHSIPSIRAFGLGFVYGTTWDPVSAQFGALPFVVGTLLTSFLALLISLPFSIGISIFIGEYFKKGALSSLLTNVTELLSGIPSIIYGFWALYILVPVVRNLQIKLDTFPYGVGIFSASLILSVMIIPYAASIGREVIAMVPSDIKEAAYSLGATRQEVITKVILPYARPGILAGILLGLGRALGETMAVTMVVGNSNLLPHNIFSPGNTMASVIANEFTEATASLYVSALMEVGLFLFFLTMIINIIGRYIVKSLSIESK